MRILSTLWTGAKSYALAQMTVGIQLGVAITYAVVALEMDYFTALAIVMPIGVPLVILQSVIANRWLSTKKVTTMPALRPITVISGDAYGWQGVGPCFRAIAGVFAFACVTTLAIGAGVTTLFVVSGDLTSVMTPGAPISGWLIGMSSYVQFLIMISTAALFIAFSKIPGRPPLLERLRTGFGVRDASLSMVLIAIIGGLTVGWFPGFLADAISDAFPTLNLGAVDMIDDALRTSGVINSMVIIAVIAVIGPLAEELVFRGFIWSRLREAMPPWAVLTITTVIFALAHLDPTQAIPLLFTGLFLGWLRLQSGSILLPVIAHVANNTLGVVSSLNDDAIVLEPGSMIGMTSIVIIVAALAWSVQKDESQSTVDKDSSDRQPTALP